MSEKEEEFLIGLVCLLINGVGIFVHKFQNRKQTISKTQFPQEQNPLKFACLFTLKMIR